MNTPISRSVVGSMLLLWWGLFASLLFLGPDASVFLVIIGFSFVLLVPGFLTMTSLKITDIGLWPYSGMVIAWSVLEIMLLGLVGNTVLPSLGVLQPLSSHVLFIELSVFVFFLWLMVCARGSVFSLPRKNYVVFERGRDLCYALFPGLFVVLAVCGAIRLNNGESGIVTILTLLGMGIYAAVLVLKSEKEHAFEEDVIPTALYFMALALLLMTSLRGWHISGHDIQTEFFVFELAKQGGVWAIESYRNAYNACMSITVLPATLSVLTRLSDPYVFKVFFQVIFAFVAPIVYTIVRRYVNVGIAFLATFYFISFPTFFGDMPMLNRQEIAFVFWSLMVFVLFEEKISLSLRRALFIIFGVGVILSHYSTTYTVIALLIGLMLARPVVLWISGFFKDGSFFRQSAMIPERRLTAVKEGTVATKWVVTILCLLTFLWSSVLTDTSSGSITRVVTKTFEAMRMATKDDTRSGDVFYSIFSWRTLDKETVLREYREKVVLPTREKAPVGTYYASSTYGAYPISVASDVPGRLTWLGELIAPSDAAAAKIHSLLRQVFAKLLQVLIIIGFFSALLRRSFQHRVFGLEFSLLAMGSLLFVASQVLLPVLSAEYGVFRAFQQSLIFLGVNIVIGSMAILVSLKKETRLRVAMVFAIFFFYAMTGVVTRVFIAEPPQLHVSNAGAYYDLYYMGESDAKGAEWIDRHIPKGEDARIQTDRPDYNGLRRVAGVVTESGIYPALIRSDAYVFLNHANTKREISTVLWNSDVIGYTYPLQFLSEQKDLLYDNGDVEIFR